MKTYHVYDMMKVHQNIDSIFYYNFDKLSLEDRSRLSECLDILKKYINRQDEDFDDFNEE